MARTNVALPPPTGPARTRHCINEGLSELYSARTAAWQAEMLLRRALAGSEVPGVLPDGAALQAGKSASFVAQRGESGGGFIRRVPVARCVARDPLKAVRERPV